MLPPPPENSTPQASTTPMCGSGPSVLFQGENPGVVKKGRAFTTRCHDISPLLLCQAAPWGF